MSKHNIVFLDIDGVLNHQEFYLSGRFSKEDMKVAYEESHIDKKSLEIFNKFCIETNSKVVISSTWRLNRTVEELRGIFKNVEATFEIVGKTERCCSRIRGVEIYNWWKANKDKYSNFVIFDDDADMLLWQAHNYFKIDSMVGITANVTYRASKFLNEDVIYNY